MTDKPLLHGLPALPMDDAGPVFTEPWQAQAFALTLKLYEGGHFTWPEWVAKLSAEIAGDRRQDAADSGNAYFRHWLAALEELLAAKDIVPRKEIARRMAEIEANPPNSHDHAPRRVPVKIA
jgi:nitrile hydratase accessory protein